MACSVRNLALAGLAVLWASQAAGATPSREPIHLDAQSFELDYANNVTVYHKVKVSQGAMSVASDQARGTGLDFEDSHWVFQGNVKIVMDQGELTSDQADVSFVKKLLATAVVTGKPAAFMQSNAANGKPVRGHADSIDYNVNKGIVRLSSNAWLSDGQNEIRGESLKYNVLDKKMVAEAADQNSQRVHITITPPPASSKP